MEFTAAQIAEMTGGQVEGNPSASVSTIAKIEEATPGSISFIANPKYHHFIASTKASIVLVGRDFQADGPIGPTLIRVDDPYATLASLLQMVSQFLEPKHSGIEQPVYVAQGVTLPDDLYLGAFAYIAKGAVIGRNVQIFPNVYVGENVTIGDGTILKPGVKIYHSCKIGARCILHAGVVIGADGFGFAPVGDSYQKIPQIGNVIVEDDVEIGANTCVDRATMGSTIIRRGAKLDNLIQVAHNCEVGANTVMASQSGIAGSAKIGANCMVGGQVGFAGHITVGDRVKIGAQSGVPRSIASDQSIMGYPAVDARQFMRQAVNVKNLDNLYARLSALEKSLKNIPNNPDNQ